MAKKISSFKLDLLEEMREANSLLTYCADNEPMGKNEVWDQERLEQCIESLRKMIKKVEKTDG